MKALIEHPAFGQIQSLAKDISIGAIKHRSPQVTATSLDAAVKAAQGALANLPEKMDLAVPVKPPPFNKDELLKRADAPRRPLAPKSLHSSKLKSGQSIDALGREFDALYEKYVMELGINDRAEKQYLKPLEDKYVRRQKEYSDAIQRQMTERMFFEKIGPLKTSVLSAIATVERYRNREFNSDGRSFNFAAKPLSWVVLPPGEWARSYIIDHVKGSAATSLSIACNTERSDFIKGLGPHECFHCRDGFESYYAFTFIWTKWVILEHPENGHAMYLFRTAWKELSRLTKSELLSDHRSDVERVIHTGDWKSRIEFLLRIEKRQLHHP